MFEIPKCFLVVFFYEMQLCNSYSQIKMNAIFKKYNKFDLLRKYQVPYHLQKRGV